MLFFLNNWRPFLEITVCQLSVLQYTQNRFLIIILIISGMLLCCKNLPVLLWGPLFVEAPVRPNMLNMRKSASADDIH